MGKRAQQSAPMKQAKVAKTVDPMEKEMAPVLRQLDKALGIVSASTVEMLQAVVPHCLKSTKEDRHEYQTSMLQSVESTLQQIEAKELSEVAEAEKALAEAEANQESAAARLETAEGQVKTCEEDKVTKDQSQETAEAAVTAATETLKAGEESEQNLGAEKEALLKDQEESQKFLTTTWEAVKNDTFGKEWRERQKAIKQTLKILDEMELDVSLKAALPNALKTKPADRKRFSSSAVQFAEEAITIRLQKLKEKLDNFEQEASSRTQAVVAAKEALAAAEATLQATTEEASAAKDALKAAQATQKEIQKEIKAAPTAIKKLRKAVDTAKEELSQSQTTLSHFQGLKDRAAPAPEPTEEAPPAEATA